MKTVTISKDQFNQMRKRISDLRRSIKQTQKSLLAWKGRALSAELRGREGATVHDMRQAG